MARDAGPGETSAPDLLGIGAGSGGLSVAAGAAQMGASVVLAEGAEMGGDCLNVGCVPSKALIAAAHRAASMRAAGAFGVSPGEGRADWEAVKAHVAGVIAAIAPHDSQERFEGLGVRVIRDWARFVSPREVEAGGVRIRPRRVVIATGSRPFVPPIPGLGEVPYLTNETVFSAPDFPARLVVLGGGAIGIELAQAFRRLGSEVTVVEAASALGREDRGASAIVLRRLRAEGVTIREGVAAQGAEQTADGIALTLADGSRVEGSHLLVAVGRRIDLSRLDPVAGGVEATERGVSVDDGLRSISNRRVYAVGDAAGRGQFTHLAAHHAGLVIRSALFRLPVRARRDHIPRVTFADPELAQVGPTEAQARESGALREVARFDYAGDDRAQAERATEGFAKVMIGRRGRVIGATVVGAQAGELIGLWALAVSKGLRIGDVAGMVAPYPTLGEVSKRAAGAYYAPRLFESPWVKRAVRLLARLG